MGNLHARVKQQTEVFHKRLGRLPFFQALSNAELPRLAIVSFLKSLAIVHATLERRLKTSDLPSCVLVEPKLPLLTADLRMLGASQLPDIEPGIRIALQFASEIIESSDPYGLLGVLYVLEGSQNGGLFLRQSYTQCLHLEKQHQPSYFGCYGDATSVKWRSFVDGLDSLQLSDNESGALVRSSVRTFEVFEILCTSLFPFADDDLRFAAAGINPEAGDHMIPQDPLEIDMALRAGRRTWQMFPYLEMRFGERGKRFTSSDSCWLAAITTLQAESVLKSLTWLRSVLAVRGIPTIILERHLLEIVEGLKSDFPGAVDRATRFDAFLSVVEAERRAICPTYFELIEKFDRKLANCPGLTFSSAAQLIASAYIDEAAGLTGAVNATERWFLDSERFSADWVTIVEELSRAMAETIRQC